MSLETGVVIIFSYQESNVFEATQSKKVSKVYRTIP
jgi:hypothetical protein